MFDLEDSFFDTHYRTFFPRLLFHFLLQLTIESESVMRIFRRDDLQFLSFLRGLCSVYMLHLSQRKCQFANTARVLKLGCFRFIETASPQVCWWKARQVAKIAQ